MKTTFTAAVDDLVGRLARGPEIRALQGIAALTFAFSFGLLMASEALWSPAWLPGQLPRLIALLWAGPLLVVMTERQFVLSSSILEAEAFVRRATVARRVALFLVLVIVPMVQQAMGGRLDQDAVAGGMLLSVALCWSANAVALRVVTSWYLLYPQSWEGKERSGTEGIDAVHIRYGRVDRTRLIQLLWRQWATGGALLVLALLLHAQLRGGGDLVTPWGYLVFLGYLVVGPLVIAQAVRLRWQSQWDLQRADAAPPLTGDWDKMALSLIGLALAGASLLLVTGLFKLAHLLVYWIWRDLCVPLLNTLLSLHLGGSEASQAPTAPTAAPTPVPTSNGYVAHVPAWVGTVLGLAVCGVIMVGLVALIVGALAGRYGHPSDERLPSSPVEGFAVRLRFNIKLRARMLGAWRALREGRNVPRNGSRWEILFGVFGELLLYVGWLLPRLRGGVRLRRESTPVPRTVAAPKTPLRRRHTLTGLLPREAVLTLYRWLLERGARVGQPRRPGQTPREYAAELGHQHPAAAGMVDTMTELFVSVRYGERPVEAGEVGDVQSLWTRLQRRLRRKH